MNVTQELKKKKKKKIQRHCENSFSSSKSSLSKTRMKGRSTQCTLSLLLGKYPVYVREFLAQCSGGAGGLGVNVKCWASCPESSLWIQGEPLMGLLSGRLGVIADNAKWEMGNAANKGKIQSGTQRWAYVIYCSTCTQKAWHWAQF